MFRLISPSLIIRLTGFSSLNYQNDLMGLFSDCSHADRQSQMVISFTDGLCELPLTPPIYNFLVAKRTIQKEPITMRVGRYHKEMQTSINVKYGRN